MSLYPFLYLSSALPLPFPVQLTRRCHSCPQLPVATTLRAELDALAKLETSHEELNLRAATMIGETLTIHVERDAEARVRRSHSRAVEGIAPSPFPHSQIPPSLIHSSPTLHIHPPFPLPYHIHRWASLWKTLPPPHRHTFTVPPLPTHLIHR